MGVPWSAHRPRTETMRPRPSSRAASAAGVDPAVTMLRVAPLRTWWRKPRKSTKRLPGRAPELDRRLDSWRHTVSVRRRRCSPGCEVDARFSDGIRSTGLHGWPGRNRTTVVSIVRADQETGPSSRTSPAIACRSRLPSCIRQLFGPRPAVEAWVADRTRRGRLCLVLPEFSTFLGKPGLYWKT